MIKHVKKIAIQGIEASFHHEAANSFFGNNYKLICCKNFNKTAEKVHLGEADYAVIAIENAIVGALLPNYNLIRDYNLRVVGEVYLPIRLHLMGLRKDFNLNSINHVISHPIAIRQSQEYLDTLPEHIEITEKFDTAGCAKLISSEQLTDTLALANKQAAELYNLEIIKEDVQTNKVNFTRFLILQKEENYQPGIANKATVSFQVGSGIGSLAAVLNTLATYHINLTKIQSTPVLGKPHKDNFFVDMIWKNQHEFDAAIGKVSRHIYNLTILGEYKQDENFNHIKSTL